MFDGTYSLSDLVRLPLRHRKKVAAFATGTMLIAFLAIVFWPREYVSESKLYIRLGRESVTLDPTTQVGQNITLNESRENEINSVLEIIHSREIAAQVVSTIGPESILAPTDTPSDAQGFVRSLLDRSSDTLKSVGRFMLGNDPPVSDHERAVTELQKHFVAEPSQKRSNVITASYYSPTAKSAQTILQAVLKVYQDEHLRVNQAAGSYQFFADQTDLLQMQLAEAKAKLRDAKNAGDLASVDGQRKLLEDQLSKVQLELSNAQAALAGGRARLAGLETLLATIPARLVAEAESGHENGAADDMRAQLYELQIREEELRAKYTDKHPLVKTIRKQVQAAESVLAQQPQSRTYVTENSNPAYQEIERSVLQEQARVEGLEATVSAFQHERRAIAQSIRELNDREILIVDLERQIELLEDSYRKSYGALEQARLSDALEQQRISNVVVLQEPMLIQKPVGPKKLESLVLATFVALFGSFGVALVSEQYRETLGSRRDVESALELPVLASFPVHVPARGDAYQSTH